MSVRGRYVTVVILPSYDILCFQEIFTFCVRNYVQEGGEGGDNVRL